MIGLIIFYLFNTASGHSKISSAVSTRISNTLGYEVELSIEDIRCSLEQLRVTFLINDALRAEVEGFILPFGKEYDIKYHLTGEKIVFKDIRFEDKVDVYGTMHGTNDDFKLTGEGVALEGKIDISLHHLPKRDRDIKLRLERVSMAKLFEILEKKPLFAGKFSLNADVPLYSEFEKKGDVALKLHRGGVYLENIRDIYGVLLPDDFMLSGASTIHLAAGQHTFNALLKSNVASVALKKGKFIEANKKLTALYHLDIEELSQLESVTKKRFSGSFVADGELEYLDGLRLDGSTDSLDGKLSYYFAKGNLEAKLEALSLAKMLSSMAYPSIMIGAMDGKAEINLDDSSAVINLRSRNLRFQRNSVINNIYKATAVDISRELFTKTYFTSSVENGIVFYDFSAKNKSSHIILSNAKMDSRQNTIDTNFDIKMQGEELSGEVYGSLKSPKVKVDVGKYIEFKAKKEIDAFFGVGTSEKVKKEINNIEVDDVKGFIKGFF